MLCRALLNLMHRSKQLHQEECKQKSAASAAATLLVEGAMHNLEPHIMASAFSVEASSKKVLVECMCK